MVAQKLWELIKTLTLSSFIFLFVKETKTHFLNLSGLDILSRQPFNWRIPNAQNVLGLWKVQVYMIYADLVGVALIEQGLFQLTDQLVGGCLVYSLSHMGQDRSL